jgi:hypothetical protein
MSAGTSTGAVGGTYTITQSAVIRATTVQVDGQTGFVNGVTFEETGENTGIFRTALTRSSIPIAFGAANTIGATSITLTNAAITGAPDITFTYSDQAPSSGSANKQFKIITKLQTSAGTLASTQSTVGVTDSFALTLTDPDLNTNPDTIETYTMTTFNGNNAVFAALNTDATRIGELRLQAKGTTLNLSTAGLAITFIETGPNTGVFHATNIDMGTINTVATGTTGVGALADGDIVAFRYEDKMQSPSVTSTASITVGKPSVSITADRTTIPVPTGTTVTKLTITVTDPTKNLSPGSVETITIAATGITVTPRTGVTLALSDFSAALNSAQTLTETGPSTGVFTKTIDIAKAATKADGDYEGGKIKFTYETTNSVTVSLKTYDAVITTDKTSVKNGEKLKTTVNDQDMNKDPTTAEKITVTVQGKSDDQALATITLDETGPDTGVFEKSITVGKDFKVSTLPTGAVSGTASTSVEIKYTETIASDRTTPTREKSIKAATSTGTVDITPAIIGPGTKFTILITDADLNVNPEGTDSVASTVTGDWVKLTSDPSGAPSATVGMEETGANTGVFKATVQLSPRATTATTPAFTASGVDHAYTALPGDIISVRYTDARDAAGNKAIISKTFKVTSVDPVMTTPKPSIAAGEAIVLTIEDADANRDGNAQDSVRVKITSDSDAVGFELSALETGTNTGIFTVNIPTTTSVSSGSVTVKTGDSVYLKYTDSFPADYADRVKQVVDASKDFTFVVLIGTPGGDPTSTTPTNPVLKDIGGNELTEVSAGSQVILSSDITNNADFSQNFAAIVEVRDADGFTVMLQWQTGILNPNGRAEIGISWTPDAPGEYTVRTFVLTSIQNPGILSPIAESTVTVS